MYLESLFNLKDKVALVTGASSGFGLHFASVLAKAGAKVALAARRKDRIDSAAQALRSEGAEACAVYLDVSDPATIPHAFDAIENELNACIDILINNAGVIYTKRFLEQEPAEVSQILDTNLKGAFVVAQEAARRMAKEHGGSIVNIASTAGLRAGGRLSSYGAAKAGLIHLNSIMALELAGKNIRVNALCPGNFDTDMHKSFSDAGIADHLIQRIPQKRLGQLSDLDGALLLFSSDAGRYITGATLTVDGGQSVVWM
jgi:NAD(P)-dependent dehydrogenase (short-subunit alcohol dehydrogenase family)